jgi:hypothetical protein
MRLQKYIINENQEDISLDKILSMIKKNCKTFLKEVDGFLYRGSNKKVFDIEKFKTRKDRRPLGTAQEDHDKLDKLFNKKFGWKARSEGLFCAGDLSTVKQYGKVNLVFPIGDYKYVWSPKVKDLTLYLEKEKYLKYYKHYKRRTEGVLFTLVKHRFDEYEELLNEYGNYEYDKFLKETVNKYISKNLSDLIGTKNEVSIKCNYYYLVNVLYSEDIAKDLGWWF